MKLKSIEKVHSGRYIHRYNITYEMESGAEKVYEMISRNPEITTHDELIGQRPDAVVMILKDASGEKILLNKEFRLATGEWVYNFTAGLIDGDEKPEEAAKRELFEETGLNLDEVTDVIPISYSAVGFANETNVCVVGTASGTIRKSDSEVEEIEAAWYTKEQVRELLKNARFAARTQAYCYAWAVEE
ncbi:MAG: NUDIX hydrolase [Eubacterium sp.]|nr:NUDIX hydrolase [Eubacterium sp.]